jgi:hypothetical protein
VLTAYLALRWGFAPNAVVMDGRRNWAAMDRSADAVRDNWWRTFGILATIALIQLGPVLLATASRLAAPLVEGFITALVSALVLPFAVAGQTLLYYYLKARKGLDVSPAAVPAPEPDL